MIDFAEAIATLDAELRETVRERLRDAGLPASDRVVEAMIEDWRSVLRVGLGDADEA